MFVVGAVIRQPVRALAGIFFVTFLVFECDFDHGFGSEGFALVMVTKCSIRLRPNHMKIQSSISLREFISKPHCESTTQCIRDAATRHIVFS